MEEEKRKFIMYKIMAGNVYTVVRNDYGDHTFYKIKVEKDEHDGSKTSAYKIISFVDDVDIPDGTKIRIFDGYESFYMKDKFNAIFTVVVKSFEIVNETTADEYTDAIANYTKSLEEIEMPF